MTKSILKSLQDVFVIYSIQYINMNKNVYLLSSMAAVGISICY